MPTHTGRHYRYSIGKPGKPQHLVQASQFSSSIHDSGQLAYFGWIHERLQSSGFGITLIPDPQALVIDPVPQCAFGDVVVSGCFFERPIVTHYLLTVPMIRSERCCNGNSQKHLSFSVSTNAKIRSRSRVVAESLIASRYFSSLITCSPPIQVGLNR